MHPYAQAVSDIYAAFGRGDIPTILEHLAEDLVWEYGHVDNDVPWLAPRRGRAGAAEFFTVLGRELEFRKFEINGILHAQNTVVALIDAELVVKRTGKTIRESDEGHIWHFGNGGRVVRFKHAADTLAHSRAWQS
ncbi:MAG TPA: nuclear transport factor 2 family protein [Polyangiales bacterium]|nr:nuclear transport factor 2 family protein [Polyangiales bacterium]